jgi:CubicO group peptidase (beta-lactamase class C family)
MTPPPLSRTLLVLALAVTLVSAPVAGTAHGSGPPASDGVTDPVELEAWFDDAMADQLERHHVPGAAVVVVADGEPVLAKGYGYADLDSRTPVVADETVFRVGSNSKLLVWTAVMQGVETGRLDLDTDVNEYLAGSPVTIPDTHAEPVTLEHLGTHTAGFEESYGGMLVSNPGDVEPLGETLAAHRPARVRPPGEFVAYSNYGSALAALVVEESTGTPFSEYADERITGPLGMRNSTFDQPVSDRLRSRLATGYTYRDGAYHPEPFQYFGIPPEGAMSATATDMGRFMLAHLEGGTYDGARVLSADSTASMHRRHFSNAPDVPEQNGMAYGFIEMSRNGERVVGHWGTSATFNSVVALFPDRDVGLFVAYSSSGGQAARFELLDAFTDRYYPAPETPTVTPPPGAEARAASVAGDYRTLAISASEWHRLLGLFGTVSVRATEEGVTTREFGGPAREWVETRPYVYEAGGGDGYLVFRDGAEGRPTHLFFGQFGSRTYERLDWYESPLVTGVVAGGALVAFVSALGLLIGSGVWRRLRGLGPEDDPGRAARWLLGLVSLGALVVVVAFSNAVVNFDAELASPSLLLRVGRVLPYLLLVGVAGATLAAVQAWRASYWRFPARLHYSLVVALAVLFVWQLHYWRLLGL